MAIISTHGGGYSMSAASNVRRGMPYYDGGESLGMYIRYMPNTNKREMHMQSLDGLI